MLADKTDINAHTRFKVYELENKDVMFIVKTNNSQLDMANLAN